jgi:hypothetical protein
MARDLNRLMDDIRRSREVFVTPEGEVEERGEAEEKARQEQSTEGAARPRTKLKPEVFGGGTRQCGRDRPRRTR